VTLNSVTKLDFPSEFTGDTRTVSLKGEAHFDVMKDASRPFHVVVDGIDIRVTGTKFNVKAYMDEATVTTLLEGGIKIRNTAKSNMLTRAPASVTIDVTPGQAVEVDPQSKQIRLNPHADTETAIAWKNGLFIMKEADIPTILREISRWYSIEIVYVNTIPTGTISGKIAKSLNLSQVIKILSKSGVNVRLDGRKLLVSP
jgi:transmembrane sensor